MLFTLLTAPLSGPILGLRFVLQQVQTLAERELMDVDRIQEELVLLHLRLEDGEISEEEYKAQEAEVIARLRAAREYREAASQ